MFKIKIGIENFRTLCYSVGTNVASLTTSVCQSEIEIYACT